MPMLVLAGEMMNAAAGRPIVCSPAAHAKFPAEELVDGDPGSYFRFGSLTADPFLYVDLDDLGGQGGGEEFDGGVPVGWTEENTGGGDVTQEASIKHSGNFALRLAASAGVATAYKDVTVRAGSKRALRWWSRADGSGGQARIRVRNLHTGKYLNALGGWQATSTPIFPESGTTYVGSEVVFTVESLAVCRRPTVTLRIQIAEETATKVSYFDDITMVPYIDTCSIHGHNIDPRSVLRLEASDVFNSGYVRIETMDVRRRAFYKTFTERAYRFWQLAFEDTNTGSGPIWMAEWVLAQAHQLVAKPRYPLRRNFSDPRIALERPVGAPSYVARGQFELGSVPLTFRCHYSQRLDFYNEVYVRSLGGAPAVVVPSTLDDEVFYGVLGGDHGEDWQLRSATRGYLDYSTIIDELALPLVTD
jgi:hypothetical protein